MNIKQLFCNIAGLFCLTAAVAQNNADPILMKINGQPILRSEFEYSYNKNNSDGVIDKKTIDEYVDLFVNYKLKVVAALDARYDTMQSFKQEFMQYRDQQIRPSFVTDADIEAEALKVYDNYKKNIGDRGQFSAAHILLRLSQQAPQEEQARIKQRIDSIHAAICEGANFAKMASQVSEDSGSARNGGMLPWIAPNQTLKEFEDVAYSLKPGEMSRPFLSPAGYHIIMMKEFKGATPYDSLRTNIIKFLEQRGVRERIVNQKLDSIAGKSEGKLTAEDILTQRCNEMEEHDSDLKNLIREYYDGLLLYEISNSTVWEKAAKDEAGLEAFFKKNKKKYKWTEPRFKGIAYHVKEQTDVEAVRNCVKKLRFDQWNDALRTTFNNDSTIRIRVEKGIFKKGDNALIDREVFKKDTTVTSLKDYPIDATFGKKLKAPEDYNDVRGLVVADYQEELEKEWVAALRRKYAVEVDYDILRTVNKH